MSALLKQMREDSPYAIYPLLEDSGTAAKDAMGGASGTYTSGYTLAQDASLFKSVLLAGEAAGLGAVTFPNGNLATMASTNATIEWWMRPSVTPVGYEIIGLTSGGGYAHPVQFMHSPSNQLRVVTGSGPPTETAAFSTLTVNLNVWNHIMVKFISSYVRLCINGQFEDLAGGGWTTRTAHGSNLMWLGWREGTGGQHGTTGHYAYLATYASALSDARCLAHYKAGLREKVFAG